jgi:RNA polymerase sigma factor (TIGR02999 family)
MPESHSGRVTQLLQDWAGGNENALDDLVPLVYQELRRLARRQLRRESPEHTLQSTALVNEAFVRLVGSQPGELRDRVHFVAVASHLMRQILVDHSRSRRARKRDGGLRIDLEALANTPITDDAQLEALNDALEELSRLDERQSRIVEMKFFGGLTAPEIAEVLGVSLATVERDWAVARLWLRRQMDASQAQ